MRRTLAVLSLLALTACGTESADSAENTDSGGNGGSAEQTVIVFAAASLTEAFTELGAEFEAANPGTDVTFNFGGSSALAQQIGQGAPADVFAAASPAAMAQVPDAPSPEVFARNRLRIAVPGGNPGRITGLADFARDDAVIALCAEQVPCGAAAKAVFAAAGITPRPDTLEQDVKAALTKVRLGEVDAALVYRTDVLAAGDEVEGLDFPEADRAVNDYPIAALTGAPNPTGARAFVEHVRSGRGRAVLAEAGFDLP
ncbi:molybdate ABC transporter substrate-binding protein [Saccharothrix syringae]|uniref:Molybdate ABC transporter substrate-binding protein n=1 Tax=Saccharothrix syringae TaxID=103733 RepID=A0A5Q0H6K6_SACSY|nr:molybdate ABC transporter substrate-binding protein [Saccharothrix syringae]QFZ21352.1 molybdate ABC transporter substrate-binding protein [Saccharothrix syringae]